MLSGYSTKSFQFLLFFQPVTQQFITASPYENYESLIWISKQKLITGATRSILHLYKISQYWQTLEPSWCKWGRGRLGVFRMKKLNTKYCFTKRFH